jgi:hypothetical protein
VSILDRALFIYHELNIEMSYIIETVIVWTNEVMHVTKSIEQDRDIAVWVYVRQLDRNNGASQYVSVPKSRCCTATLVNLSKRELLAGEDG